MQPTTCCIKTPARNFVETKDQEKSLGFPMNQCVQEEEEDDDDDDDDDEDWQLGLCKPSFFCLCLGCQEAQSKVLCLTSLVLSSAFISDIISPLVLYPSFCAYMPWDLGNFLKPTQPLYQP